MSRIVFLTAAALNPGMMKHGKVVDINHFHVSRAHAHASVLQATARQHNFRSTGQLVSCWACSMAKGNRAPTAHHTTARAKRPMGLIHIDTAGPFPASLGGSRYVVMFVDSASRLQRPYGTRDKTVATILAVVKRFTADMGVPRAFRSDNGREYTNSSFVEFCNNLGIRLELTAPYTPQQNGPVESALWRAFKAGHAARLGISKIHPDIRVNEVTARQRQVCGWSHCCGPRSASIGRLPRQMTDGFPPMRYFMGTARCCRCCYFSSRPTTECPDNIRVIPVPACVSF